MKEKKRNYPFVAIVGQEKMKLALILNIINPLLSGVLIRGEKGTAKSTAVRALAEILPEIEVISRSPFVLDPDKEYEQYLAICAALGVEAGPADALERNTQKVQVIELPVGATEDRVAGTLDLEHALQKGEKRVEPGLLAHAHRGVLYVDEVNLLDDHVVDILLDAAAMGVNTIEREGISFSHPARFTLVGTMNPEEGELRPQLLDRFGLCVNIRGIDSVQERVAIMERRVRFDEDPATFCDRWQEESDRLVTRITMAMELYNEVEVRRELLHDIAQTCLEVGIDGHRGDIIILKTARTLAAWHNRTEVQAADIKEAADLALPHRIRRQPLMDIPDSMESYRAAGTAL
ncbi:MAG TPA: magnesium chelatase ATPase subunit I [Desulfobulbus sp.]|nr:magnesium chelatase ATPase subunit I [Desulfobulbus sp.]